MDKKEMTIIGAVVDQAYGSTPIDEKLIAKFLTKGIDDLDKELKAIDKQYDDKFASLDKDIRTLYSDWIKDKQKRREFVEESIKKASDSSEKEKLLTTWFKINSEIDVLFLEKKEYLKNYEIKLVEEKTKKEKRALTLQIAKAAVPVVIKGILFGLDIIARANNITAIGNSIPKISKK
ncbi:hypothetical protein DYE49_04110 [Treponema rectale]|uniref:Uncharacterized protein n=1 Tax=Treponema rectale TaxID=744512 RepID=A0A7M1XJ56_9SPIR|nr:hypothetical protein DYE49_04110 [Treponema rectale]